jgi:carboxyl-terminal processing protease
MNSSSSTPRRAGRGSPAIAVLGLTFALAFPACSTAGPPAAARTPPPSWAQAGITPELATLTFDSAWSRIAATHYDTAFGGVDWHAVRAELRPRAQAATSLGQLRAVIGDMLDRLHESHYALIPHEVADALGEAAGTRAQVSGDAGLAVRLVGGELLVTEVRPGSAAAAAGIRMGWALLAVDGRPMAPLLQAAAALPPGDQRTARTRLLYAMNGALRGDVGDTLRLRLRDGSGREHDRRVPLQASRGAMVRFGNLPPVLALLEHEELTTDAGCVGVIRLNIWMVPLAADFDRAVDALRHCRGMVIDLRGNPGGVGGMVMGTAGHFLNDTLPLGFMRQRTGEMRFKANPRRVGVDGTSVEPFAGPLAVLMDEMSASTSEFFAAALQAVGRARVFGEGSAGQALPALMLRLPTNDVLMHVVADFTGPGGVRIEGRGVVPDVAIAATRQQLLEGRDATLDAALAWISATPTTNGDE